MPGDLFFAITGPNHDGHRFLEAAAQRGAKVAVVSESVTAPEGMTLIRVEETTRALGKLAADERRRRDLIVVAITGSSGKTTTRELTRAALSGRYRAESSKKNLNNQWGLPLSILGLDASTQVAVLELGMNHAGEIAGLTRLCTPDVGVITNIGQAHLGFFSGLEEIAAAKAELLHEMPGGASAVLPAGDRLLLDHAHRSGRRTLTFGTEESAQVRGTSIQGDLVNGMRFEVGTQPVGLRLWGGHSVLNALAALAVCRALGMPASEAAPGLGQIEALPGRGNARTLAGDGLLVDESYNSNPSAVKAVLKGLAATPWSGRRVAVLGDMLELGKNAAVCHEQIGAAAVEAGIELLVAVGEFGGSLQTGAQAAGACEVVRFEDSSQAAADLPGVIRAGDLVLVKGSRGVRLETVVEAICAARRLEAKP